MKKKTDITGWIFITIISLIFLIGIAYQINPSVFTFIGSVIDDTICTDPKLPPDYMPLFGDVMDYDIDYLKFELTNLQEITNMTDLPLLPNLINFTRINETKTKILSFYNLPLLEKNWSEGFYQELYFNYYVLSHRGDILYQGDWVPINQSSISRTISLKIPEGVKSALLYSVVYQKDYSWNCSTWDLDQHVYDHQVHYMVFKEPKPKIWMAVISAILLIALLAIITIFVIMPLLSKKKSRRK